MSDVSDVSDGGISSTLAIAMDGMLFYFPHQVFVRFVRTQRTPGNSDNKQLPLINQQLPLIGAN